MKRKLVNLSIIFSLLLNIMPLNVSAAETVDYSELGTVYEAEDAVLENVEIYQEFISEGGAENTPIKTYSGTGFVGQFANADEDFSKLTFTIDIPEDGEYDLIFMTCSPYGEKKNNYQIDDAEVVNEGIVSAKADIFCKNFVSAELTKGSHTIKVSENWGYFYIDALVVKKQEPKIEELTASPDLVNPNSNQTTKDIMKYLSESYGNVVLSGQYSEGIDAPEALAIYTQTGKYPAIMGFDFMDYSLSRIDRLSENEKPQTVEKAIEWWNKGGLVTFCWHWNAPKDLIDDDDNPWNKGFYSKATTFSLDKALNGDDPQGYELLMKDIDNIAQQLKILQDAGVTVIWRPLHEASGGWFWWGNSGSESYKELWNIVYDKLTNEHGLNNLIWLWNGQCNGTDSQTDWYPGDDTVDIIGEDIYADTHDYSSQVEKFAKAMNYTKADKIITLSETGVIPNPELLEKDGAMWSWFAPWYREFTVDMNLDSRPYSGTYTSVDMLRQVYNSDIVITLDELPTFNKKAKKPEVAPIGLDVLTATNSIKSNSLLGWIIPIVVAGVLVVLYFVSRIKKK